jgi:DNA-binding GntR family transcriptional regulator
VRRLSTADIADIYRVRRHIETAAADADLEARHREDLARAFQALERAAAEREWSPLVEADLAFHRALVGVLGSDRLDRVQRALELELRLAFSLAAFVDREFEDPDPLVADHRAILDHLLDGDADRFRARLLEHLDRHEAGVTRAFETLDD